MVGTGPIYKRSPKIYPKILSSSVLNWPYDIYLGSPKLSQADLWKQSEQILEFTYNHCFYD